MLDVQITIKNKAQIKAAFDRAPGLMAIALPKAINQSLLFIGAAADKNLQSKVYDQPISASGYKRTGNLLGSVLDPDRGLLLATPGIYKGHVGSGVGYGLFVEMGTRFMPARPFLKPAATESEMQVQKFFTDAVQGVLNVIGSAT